MHSHSKYIFDINTIILLNTKLFKHELTLDIQSCITRKGNQLTLFIKKILKCWSKERGSHNNQVLKKFERKILSPTKLPCIHLYTRIYAKYFQMRNQSFKNQYETSRVRTQLNTRVDHYTMATFKRTIMVDQLLISLP